VEVGGQGACSADYRETQLAIISFGAPVAYLLWGGRLASPADPGVGAGNGAGSFPGSSLDMRLLSPARNRSINPGAIKKLATITVQKVVDSGSATPDQWCFNISPNPNGESLPKCPASGGNTVTFVGLPSGNYQITETNVSGYSFASGIGSSPNCTFSGSTATASVTSAVTPVDATCVFHNAQNLGTIRIIKDSVPDDPQDFSFGGDLGTFSLDDDTDPTLSNIQTFTGRPPGAYRVGEGPIPVGWDLTSIICQDPDNGTTISGGVAYIDLDAGEGVVCTFTNTKRGTIIVEKQTDIDGQAGSFTFTGTAAGTISDNGQIVEVN